MNTKKFDLNKHIHFGYQTYKEYYEAQGVNDIEKYIKENGAGSLQPIQKQIEKEITLNAQKYIDMILNEGFRFIFNDIQRILDIDSRNHIQTNIIPNMETMYITKPCRDLIYAMIYKNKKYLETFQESIGTWMLDEYKAKANHEETEYKEPYEVYGLKDLRKYGIDKNKFRKKLWFTYDDLSSRIDEKFKKEVVNEDESVEYVNLTHYELTRIIDSGLKSEKTIRKAYNLTNLTQLKRRIAKSEGDKKKIDVEFKVLMENEKGFTKAMARYMIDLPE